MAQLTLTSLKHIPLIRPGDNLADILVDALRQNDITLQDGDVLVLAQKIVSKAEGRMVLLRDITPTPAAEELSQKTGKDPRLAELILQESAAVLRTRMGTAIVEHKLGFVCANAGIDHSNVSPEEDAVLLLPKDPDASARQLRDQIQRASGARIGVLIIDSHGRAWRLGTVGTTIGVSGIPALMDERGWEDLFGYKLQITVVGIADELAAAASLMMGQAAEGTPAVHVRGFPYPLSEGRLSDLLRTRNEDMFR